MRIYDTGLPRPLTARNLWNWAYYNKTDSVMYAAAETARLGTVSRQAKWSETKTPSKSPGFSDNSRQVWVETQKQVVRGIINKLSPELKSLGNMLYMPDQDVRKIDINRTINTIRIASLEKIDKKHASKVIALHDIVLMRYWDSISSAIEGGTPKSMEVSGSEVKSFFNIHGRNIDTRYWQREYSPVWAEIINIIRDLDRQALRPLDEFINSHFDKLARLEEEAQHEY